MSGGDRVRKQISAMHKITQTPKMEKMLERIYLLDGYQAACTWFPDLKLHAKQTKNVYSTALRQFEKGPPPILTVDITQVVLKRKPVSQKTRHPANAPDL